MFFEKIRIIKNKIYVYVYFSENIFKTSVIYNKSWNSFIILNYDIELVMKISKSLTFFIFFRF